MKLTANELYNKIMYLSQKAKNEFRRRGFIIPSKNTDGTIQVGPYLIKRNPSGFYTITDHANNIIVDHLNLPHTAAVLANELALGRDLDQKILEKDREYGYAEFEDQMVEHSLKNNKSQDYIDILRSKFKRSEGKKEVYKNDIVSRYKKLTKIA
jgi:hypothetical protein